MFHSLLKHAYHPIGIQYYNRIINEFITVCGIADLASTRSRMPNGTNGDELNYFQCVAGKYHLEVVTNTIFKL